MRWSRTAQLPLATRLRTLVVLGLILAALAETPLRGSWATPTGLNPGGTDTVAGSVLPPSGAPGAPVLAAAKKHKRDKQQADKPGKDKSDNKDTPGKDTAGKKGTHQGAGKGRPKGDKPKSDKRGKHEGTQDRKRKDKNAATGHIAAADVMAAATTPLTVTPVADTLVKEADPNANYGTRSRLTVDGGDDPDYASYLLFDVSGVSAPVQQATLRLRVTSNGGTRNGPEVQSTDTSWSETELTWSNRPAPSGALLDDKERLSGSTWAEYDVTRAVHGNGIVAFVLLPQSRDGAVFDSREGDRGPELVIVITDDTPPPTPEPSPTATAEPDPTATPPAGESGTLLAAGDIVSCSSSGDEATAKLLDDLTGTVATLGDNAYQSGTSQEFTDCYGSSWGRHKSRTRPALGNHEYLTSGAAGYFGYFSPDVQTSYYSYELGAWHIVVLDSNCSQVGGCGAGSPQETWLRQDLADHPTNCTLAYWHHPRFSFGNYSNDPRTQALWQVLDEAGAEIVLAGHDHNYQRWTPLNGAGDPDPNGIRQFVVGTGGKSHYSLGNPPPTVEKSDDTTFGVLQLTLHPTGYEWTFVPEADKSFTDTGTGTCH